MITATISPPASLSGSAENVGFIEDPRGEVFQAFDYRTPLNDGNGFTWFGERRLLELNRRRYDRGGAYHLRGEQLHTIRIAGPETILMLAQHADKLPMDVPTTTYTRDREPPSLSGLYSRFKPDEIRARLDQLAAVADLHTVIRD